jgi:hypothetical protein
MTSSKFSPEETIFKTLPPLVRILPSSFLVPAWKIFDLQSLKLISYPLDNLPDSLQMPKPGKGLFYLFIFRSISDNFPALVACKSSKDHCR